MPAFEVIWVNFYCKSILVDKKIMVKFANCSNPLKTSVLKAYLTPIKWPLFIDSNLVIDLYIVSNYLLPILPSGTKLSRKPIKKILHFKMSYTSKCTATQPMFGFRIFSIKFGETQKN